MEPSQTQNLPRQEDHPFSTSNNHPPWKHLCPYCQVEQTVQTEKLDLNQGWTLLNCKECQNTSIFKPPIFPPAPNLKVPSPAFLKIQNHPPMAVNPLATPAKNPSSRSKITTIVEKVATQGKAVVPKTIPTPESVTSPKTPVVRKQSSRQSSIFFGVFLFSWIFLFLNLFILTGLRKTRPKTEVFKKDLVPLLEQFVSSQEHLTQSPKQIQTIAYVPTERERTIDASVTTVSSETQSVEVVAPVAILREGPGLNYPRAGIAKSKQTFTLTQWNGNWFQVRSAQRDFSAWIRNDLVKLTSNNKVSSP